MTRRCFRIRCPDYGHSGERIRCDCLTGSEPAFFRPGNQQSGRLPGTQTEIPIKENNFAYFLVKALAEKNLFYHWSWVPCHVGYVRFDEGIAILSKEPIQAVEQIQLSTINDFQSYHTRRGLLVQTESACFVSVHLSWWKDEEENPFLTEWRSLETAVKKMQDKPVYIMGDINNPADIRNEGYDLITQSGWHDAYANAAVREGSATVPPAIAGWEENTLPLRIDYIFSNRPQAVEKYEIKFDGNKLSLAFPTITVLRSRIPERYVLIFVK